MVAFQVRLLYSWELLYGSVLLEKKVIFFGAATTGKEKIAPPPTTTPLTHTHTHTPLVTPGAYTRHRRARTVTVVPEEIP